MWPVFVIGGAVLGYLFGQRRGQDPEDKRRPPQSPEARPEPTPRQQAQAAPTTSAPAPLPKPMYPEGMEARLGGSKVTIDKAWLDSEGAAHYEVTITGTPLGMADAKGKAVSEKILREQLAKQTKLHLADDQYLPQGVTVYANGQGGKVENVFRASNGQWTYRVAGWPNAVEQTELVKILTGGKAGGVEGEFSTVVQYAYTEEEESAIAAALALQAIDGLSQIGLMQRAIKAAWEVGDEDTLANLKDLEARLMAEAGEFEGMPQPEA